MYKSVLQTERQGEIHERLCIFVHTVFRWISKRNWTIYEMKVLQWEYMGNWKTVANFVCIEMLTSEHTVHPKIWIASKRLKWKGRKVNMNKSKMRKKRDGVCVCGNIYHSHLYGVFPFRKSTFYEYNARTHSHKKRTKIQNKTKLRAK